MNCLRLKEKGVLEIIESSKNEIKINSFSYENRVYILNIKFDPFKSIGDKISLSA